VGALVRSLLAHHPDAPRPLPGERPVDAAPLARALAPAIAALKADLHASVRDGGTSFRAHRERRALDAWSVRAACHFALHLRAVPHTVTVLEQFPPSLNLYLLFGERYLAEVVRGAELRELRL
jgi:hypothetical protein